jgi:branched-chain amino acid transport system ATP-binding protein
MAPEDDVLQHAHGCYADRGGSSGRRCHGEAPHALTERGIGRTFQNICLFHNMTARENVMVGMHARLKGGSSSVPGRLVKKEEKQAATTQAACVQAARNQWEQSPGTSLRRSAGSNARPGDPAEAALLNEPTAGMNPQETADSPPSSRGSVRRRS